MWDGNLCPRRRLIGATLLCIFMCATEARSVTHGSLSQLSLSWWNTADWMPGTTENFFHTDPVTGKAKVRVPAWPVPGDALFITWQAHVHAHGPIHGPHASCVTRTSTWEVETRGSETQGHLGYKLKANRGYKKPCLRNRQKITESTGERSYLYSFNLNYSLKVLFKLGHFGE